MTPDDMLADWMGKARLAHSLGPDEPWPAWSTGECLAVALILDDTETLTAMDYTRNEALDRLRYDLRLPSAAVAGSVFDQLRADLHNDEERP